MPQQEQSDATAIAPDSNSSKIGGGVMVRDPVCGVDIDEINVPESLQAEREDSMYYFRSPECKLEFDQNPGKFMTKLINAIRTATLHEYMSYKPARSTAMVRSLPANWLWGTFATTARRGLLALP